MIPLILVCAAPRTGTNHLMRLMTGFPGLKVHTEVFARDHAFSMQPEDIAALTAITGCQCPPDPGSPTTTQLVYDEPYAALHALWATRDREKHKALVVKLFGYHIGRPITKALFEIGAKPLVWKRRKIDAYASRLKAQKLQRWINVDTTRVQVDADIRDYLYWSYRHADWYAHVSECCPDAPTFHYEDGFNMPAIGEALGLGEWREVPGYRRQDRSNSVEDRIANWDEFAKDLEREGLLEDAFGQF